MTTGGPQQPSNRPMTATASDNGGGDDSWEGVISEERIQYLLQTLYEYYHPAPIKPADQVGPFAGARLSGADVRWLTEYILVAANEGKHLGDPNLLIYEAHF